MSIKFKTLHTEISNGSQDISFKEILETTVGENKIKMRMEIKSDSYHSQCHARLHVFSPTDLKWNCLVSIPYSEMKTPAKLYYNPNNTGRNQKWFMDDRTTLLNKAAMVLG